MVKPTASFALHPVNIAVKGFTTAPNTALDLDAQRRHQLIRHAHSEGDHDSRHRRAHY